MVGYTGSPDLLIFCCTRFDPALLMGYNQWVAIQRLGDRLIAGPAGSQIRREQVRFRDGPLTMVRPREVL